MTTVQERHWLSVAQAAEIAGVSTKTIRRALEAGELEASQTKKGGKWHIRRTNLDTWLSGGGERW